MSGFEFENKINVGHIATIVSFISACSLLYANVKQMEKTVKELQETNQQMDKKIELIEKSVQLAEYRAAERWTRIEMLEWTSKLGKRNPSIDVPEI